jgi:uncharacterized protein
MLGGLPVTVDPILLADQGARLAGRVPLRNMPRLKAQLLDDRGEAEIDLAFERSSGANLRRMHGRVTAQVDVTCQRCLEKMTIEIAAAPDTILLRSGEPDPGLPPDADVLRVAMTPTPVADLIEDELLLALPMVPMHALDECPARSYIANVPGTPKRKRPFADLARRKPDNE